MNILKRFITDEEGADAVEYALVIALIALAIVAGATFMGNTISSKLNSVANSVNACTTGNTSC
ncbi:MAG TPA: Flp family type IVb pilin [Chloroflexota bacterium]|nr:Flp family type IVb pilin [Chloroflexota bacterium]